MKLYKLFFPLIFLICMSCQKDDDSILEDCVKVEISEGEYVMMQITPSTVSNNSTNFWIIENHTPYFLGWGTRFSLYYKEKNKWKQIDVGSIWEDIGFFLCPEKTKADQMNLYSVVKNYNKGKKGRYRIVREYRLNAGSFLEIDCALEHPVENRDFFKKISLYAEFEIN